MKIVVAPDKFKGSLSSFEVCEALKEGFKQFDGDIDVSSYPMADGGDGFASVLKHYLHMQTVFVETVDPLGRPINTQYEWDQQRRSAVIEMALASGLVLLKKEERNPLLASTFGTGLMIKEAISHGASRIVLGLGGSATNDAGTGILSALGFKFFDKNNNPVNPSGAALNVIKRIETPERIPDISFDIACDVQNKMYGNNGAAFIYAPQKGADAAQVKLLDEGLRNFAEVIKNHTGREVSAILGSGAAGGIAAGLLPYFNVSMKKGIEMIVDAGRIKDALPGAQLLVTGEGRIDNQSSTGKVVGYLSSLAKEYGVPCYAICGESDLKESEWRELGLQRIVTLVDANTTRDETMMATREYIINKAPQLL